MSRLKQALSRIDAVNTEGPDDKELVYGRRMSERLERFEPAATEALQIAARAQHIARWRIPRSDYPAGRAGYRKWRTTLGRLHADVCAEILGELSYDAQTIERVRAMLTKSKIKQDAEVQTLEDVACLVFLEHYSVDFAGKHETEKIIGILRKTWKKMSERGHAAALAMDLPEPLRPLLQRALADG